MFLGKNVVIIILSISLPVFGDLFLNNSELMMRGYIIFKILFNGTVHKLDDDSSEQLVIINYNPARSWYFRKGIW